MDDLNEDKNADVLNLDDLFGNDRPIKVLWGKREYLLLRSQAFGPRQVVRLSVLRRKVNGLLVLDDLNKEQEQELAEIMDEFLLILCEDFPVEKMDFAMKFRVMNFYTQETSKNLLAAALRKTGATSPVS